jgi:hypothetical protein
MPGERSRKLSRSARRNVAKTRIEHDGAQRSAVAHGSANLSPDRSVIGAIVAILALKMRHPEARVELPQRVESQQARGVVEA